MKAANESGVFQTFFEQAEYVRLKNHLYNYRLRKQAIERILQGSAPVRLLEVGSGLSPIMTDLDCVVFAELSHTALKVLRTTHRRGWYVVCDCSHLPFKDTSFSHEVCSEVLEHVKEDAEALSEMSRVLEPGGRLVITFPHRKFYFAVDDRFVEHLRRYELPEMRRRLKAAHLQPGRVEKVLGPLDKAAMCLAVVVYGLVQKAAGSAKQGGGDGLAWVPMGLVEYLFKWANRAFAAVARLDARLTPAAQSTVLLIEARKLD